MKKAIDKPTPKRPKRAKASEPARELPAAPDKPAPKRPKRVKASEPAPKLPAASVKPAPKRAKRVKAPEPPPAPPVTPAPKEPWQTEEWLARVHEFAAGLGFGPEHSELAIRTFTHRSIG